MQIYAILAIVIGWGEERASLGMVEDRRDDKRFDLVMCRLETAVRDLLDHSYRDEMRGFANVR